MKFDRLYLIILFTPILIVFLTHCGSKGTANAAKEKEVFPVQVTRVVQGNVERRIAYLGNLEACKEIKVYSTIPTRVTELKVDVNSWVNEGDLLAVVDNVKVRQGVLQAEAGLKSAQAQFENIDTEWKRIQKLYKENAVSKSQYDIVKSQRNAAKAAVNQMQAALKSAKEQYNDSFIKAPISGFVSMRNYYSGDQTNPQIPIFTIVQMDTIKIKIDIVEAQISQVKAGMKAYIQVETYPGEIFVGKVNKVYPTINPMTRTIPCEIVIDNSDLRLKPGGFARVEIVTDEHDNVLIIPKHSIIEKTSLEYLGGEIRNTRINIENFVFVIQDSIALMRRIQTGLVSDNKVEVLAGLSLGDTIITIGQYNISDSSLVKVIDKGKQQ